MKFGLTVLLANQLAINIKMAFSLLISDEKLNPSHVPIIQILFLHGVY